MEPLQPEEMVLHQVALLLEELVVLERQTQLQEQILHMLEVAVEV